MKTYFCFLFTLFLFIGASAFAQTPDGTTPADEDTCRGVYGAAFGLCNAFCEAQDCNSLDPINWNSSCFDLLANYEAETNNPGPPCFCNGACDLDFQDCMAKCGPADQCCPVNCRNARTSCKLKCCVQQHKIDYNICIEDCNGDPNCEVGCIQSGCGASYEICYTTPN